MTSNQGPSKRERTHTQSSTSVRSKLNDQLSKLQVKHNAEIEFLEDFKSFAKQRAAIEKEYAQGLQRLVQQFKKKDSHPPPELSDFDRSDNRGLVEVWQMLMDKTDEVSKQRLTVADMLLSKISEEMKQQKRFKEQTFKRHIETAQRMNSEILDSLKELTNTKKTYSELEKVCEDARTKFTEAETRLRKKDLKFFESFSSLEKTHKKCSERLKSCQKRTTVGRNDYILALEMTNQHLDRHCNKDLPNLMLAMDGEMYEKARDMYMLYAQIEADTANFVKAEFEDLREQSYLVNRAYVLGCFLHRYPVLKQRIEYTLETFGQDQVTVISREHGAEIFLDKDARKWATKLTKDQHAITALEKQVKGLRSVTSAYTKNPEFGTFDAQVEAFQNIDSLQEEIRQFEVQNTKAESRLSQLRLAGIDVSKWIQKANSDMEKQEKEHSIGPNRVSQLSLPTHGGSQELDPETASIHSAYSGFGGEADSIGSSKSLTPKQCVALYNYTAQRPDELDITVDQELEVLEWDDGDGWCKGRNSDGLEGFFPQSYVQPSSRSSSPQNVTLVQSDGGSGSAATATTAAVAVSATPARSANPSPASKPTLLKAIYEYTAQYDEELTFPEGATIELVKMDANGVDDGWWQGSYGGRVGVFPSVVVEVISNGTNSPPNGSISLDSVTPDLSTAPPPPDSPPPLPPNFPGLGGSHPLDNLTAPYSLGPNAVAIPDAYPKTSSPLSNYSDGHTTPGLRVETATPDEQGTTSLDYDGSRTWRIDSFDDDDSVV